MEAVRISRDSEGFFLWPKGLPEFVQGSPLTVAENVLAHGTGALNIDGCRVGTDGGAKWVPQGDKGDEGQFGGGIKDGGIDLVPGLGRWPANLIHDGSEEVLASFPAQAGAAAPVKGSESSRASTGRATGERERVPGAFHGDTGSAARFFYCAKASRKDRNEGLEHRAKDTTDDGRTTPIDNPYLRGKTERHNTHPTVKPTDLMRYLCRLVTPPGGVVLDPFAGSGSTGKAAVLEGFHFIGIEREAEYVEIARARIGLQEEPKSELPRIRLASRSISIWR